MSDSFRTLQSSQRDIEKEFEKERAQRRAEIAVLKARLDKAGIPALSADEEKAIRLPIIQEPELDPAQMPEPTVLPTRRRAQKGRL